VLTRWKSLNLVSTTRKPKPCQYYSLCCDPPRPHSPLVGWEGLGGGGGWREGRKGGRKAESAYMRTYTLQKERVEAAKSERERLQKTRVHTAESESTHCRKRERDALQKARERCTAESEREMHCRKREREALQKARVRTAESDRKTETHVRTHTHTHARTHFRAYTSTHARTHRHAKTHTRTQTHDRQVLTNLARHNEEARNTIREAGGEALARAALKRHRTALQVEHYAQWCLGALLVHA